MPFKDSTIRREHTASCGREWYKRNRDRVLERSRKRHRKTYVPRKRKSASAAELKRRKLNSKYGRGAGAHYEQQKAEQNNRCAMCGRSREEFLRDLAQDHNHLTNQLRGLLCVKCNIGLHYYLENREWHESAIAYLEKWARN